MTILQSPVLSCVWWEGRDWSTAGCQLSHTDRAKTVCHCNHLTSFGIMFSGTARPDDPVLSVLTDVLLVLSSLALLATQALLYFVIK